MTQWVYAGIYAIFLLAISAVVLVAAATRVYKLVASLIKAKSSPESVIVFFTLVAFAAIVLVILRFLFSDEGPTRFRDALLPTGPSYLDPIHAVSKMISKKIDEFIRSMIDLVTSG